jgi:hypothetical protein
LISAIEKFKKEIETTKKFGKVEVQQMNFCFEKRKRSTNLQIAAGRP